MTEPVGATRRADMVARLRSGGIHDERVLAAMETVPRERFVSEEDVSVAYAEQPLPIGAEQTISAPEMVAMMAAAVGLTGTENVLEVGGGRATRPRYCPAAPAESSPSNGTSAWPNAPGS